MPKISTSLVKSIFMVIIVLIVLYYVLSDTEADVSSAAGNLSINPDSNNYTHATDTFPLVSFFKKKGVVLLALMAGIVITVITAVFSLKSHK